MKTINVALAEHDLAMIDFLVEHKKADPEVRYPKPSRSDLIRNCLKRLADEGEYIMKKEAAEKATRRDEADMEAKTRSASKAQKNRTHK